MTLVPNHLPLLSGSKFVIAIILISIIFSGCEFLRIQPARKPYDPTKDRTVRTYEDIVKDRKDKSSEIKITEEPEKTGKELEIIDTVAIDLNVEQTDSIIDSLQMNMIDTLVIDTIFDNSDFMKTEVGISKDNYTFALLLPFKSNEFYNSSEQDTILESSKRAVELYEGMIIGLEQLTGIGMNIDAYVFDTENSEATTNTIITQLYSYPVDLIVGPVYNKNLRLVSEYAKNNNIYQLSPLSPTNTITEQNPYFIQAKPSIATHCNKMANYILQNFVGANALTISRNTEKEVGLASIFEGIAAATKVVVDADIELETYLDAGRSNVIIVPSFNELFVNETLRRLNILSQKYNITVFGMPTWLDWETMDFDYLQNLKAHFTSDFHIDENSDLHQAFFEAYTNRFKAKPTINAYKGFDMMVYFGRMLSQGTELAAHFDLPQHKGIYTDFFIRPGHSKDSFENYDYFENKAIHVLKLEDYKLFKLE